MGRVGGVLYDGTTQAPTSKNLRAASAPPAVAVQGGNDAALNTGSPTFEMEDLESGQLLPDLQGVKGPQFLADMDQPLQGELDLNLDMVFTEQFEFELEHLQGEHGVQGEMDLYEMLDTA
jgi:hypothetical protein